jgi:hypothetical protein
MKALRLLVIFVLIILAGNCITPFTPDIEEEKNMLVVKGMITDQYGINEIKLTRSVPLGKKNLEEPYRGCTVTIINDLGNTFQLTEVRPGVYVTDPEQFKGIAGRKYKIKIQNNKPGDQNHVYESPFIELKQVPQIDSIYYKKVDIDTPTGIANGCQIYIDTHDPLNKCKNYIWDFTETWEFHLPYDVKNRICWISQNSEIIKIKSTSLLAESKVTGFPLYYVPPYSDRFQIKYSILVNQYSIDDQEYDYWLKVQNIAEEVGTLYDVTPASIAGNIYCIDDSTETVLGYFSVSSVCSKRFFIRDTFLGLIDRYVDCPYLTIFGTLDGVTGLGSMYWIIEEGYIVRTKYWILTRFHDCEDCRIRGTDIEPSFWHNDE